LRRYRAIGQNKSFGRSRATSLNRCRFKVTFLTPPTDLKMKTHYRPVLMGEGLWMG
jgi:hypothetical protein